ncbi:merozoite surface protein 1, putative [Plasmodium malariae]|uniref:Merozoite surface protein 1 n=23 Tax=Plasmodium TaxID=5820 RepID=A0A1D3JMS5_PLAMA|nr:merozoite surface protein 1, putative [Plasmodium malariae]SBT87957.1 merozoite surface protein 1, putative [Plasmodium malariae]
MKALIFLFSFVFFSINCHCETNEDYEQLIQKLGKLEELVVEGYNLFHKKKFALTDINKDGNTSTTDANNKDDSKVSSVTAKIGNFVSKVLNLNLPGYVQLTFSIRELITKYSGLKYLIEGYEEFNELMYGINFYYDLLRAKLNDMHLNGYCDIPNHLKINEKELEMLKKVVFGYRKPLENIKDDINKMEKFITTNEATVNNIKELIKKEYNNIADENKKLEAPSESGSDDEDIKNCNEKQKIYKSRYNILFYEKQLLEAQKLIEVLKKRIQTLKENTDIKKLLDEIKEIEGKLPTSGSEASAPAATPSTIKEPENTQIKERQEKIKEIAKNIVFNMDGLFTDAFELDYYVREKEKKTFNSATTQLANGKAVNRTPPAPVMYPHGIIYAVSDDAISNILSKSSTQLTLEELQNPDNRKQITIDDLKDENKRKELITKIKNKITEEEGKLNALKGDVDSKLEKFKKIEGEFKPLLEKFYDERLDNSITTENFEKFLSKRTEYLTEKNLLERSSYELSKALVKKLKKQLMYLEDYSLRKEVFDEEVNHFNCLDLQLNADIHKLESEIKRKENLLTVVDTLKFSDVVELQVQKVLLGKKIGQLKNVEASLQKAKLKETFHIPQAYGTGEQSEPYYLIALKREIDKLNISIPKIEEMLKNEKKLEEEKIKAAAQNVSGHVSGADETPNSPGSSGATGTTGQAGATGTTGQAGQADKLEQQEQQDKLEQQEQQDKLEQREQQDKQEQQEQQDKLEQQEQQDKLEQQEQQDKLEQQEQQDKQEQLEQRNNRTSRSNGNNRTSWSNRTTGQRDNRTSWSNGNNRTSRSNGNNRTSWSNRNNRTSWSNGNNRTSRSNRNNRTSWSNRNNRTSRTSRSNRTTNRDRSRRNSGNWNRCSDIVQIKLYDFLKTAYVCHINILVNNSTMNETLLQQYKLKIEEDKKLLEKCDQLDLLFNVQNNLQVMYSMYDSVSNVLQNQYKELNQKEMIYNIYKLVKKNDKLKNFLNLTANSAAASSALPPPPSVPPAVPPASQQPQPQAALPAQPQAALPAQPQAALPAQPQAAVPAQSQATVPAQSQAAVPATTQSSSVSAPTGTNGASPATPVARAGSENAIQLKANDNEDDANELDFDIDDIYIKYLEQVSKYDENFKNFIESKKDIINKMSESEWKELGEEINTLKQDIQSSFDNFGKYKLKLERLLKKKNKITSSTNHIKEYSILKAQLLRKKNILNNPRHVLAAFVVFFNKKIEAEKKEVENALKNTDIMLKYYKARTKYYISEAFPLKTITEQSLQKEINYLHLEKFKVYSRLEGRIKKMLNLEKENITYLSGGLHHVLTELKEIINDKTYTGYTHTKNNEEVNKALNVYEELLPKQISTEEQPDNALADGTENATEGAEVRAATAESLVQGEDEYPEEVDEVIVFPIVGKKEKENPLDQITKGQAETKQDDNILKPITNEYEVLYIKPLAGVYRVLRKQIGDQIDAFNSNLTNALDTRKKKRTYFLDVLNSDLIQFKHATSDSYIIKDPYKLLDVDKKAKLIGSYKYIVSAIEKDITSAENGVEYYDKMTKLYKTQLEAVKSAIAEAQKEGDKKTENEKYIPFLTNMQTLYENLLNKINGNIINLKTLITNCNLEKDAVNITISKLTEYSKFDEKIEMFKNSKNEKDIASSGILDILKQKGLVNKNESTKIISELLGVDSNALLNISAKHACTETKYPENAGCYRYEDGKEVWRCLLNYKLVDGQCVEDEEPSCQVNNGGCAPEANCTKGDDNKIVCACNAPYSEPIFEGVFCGSSSFLGLSLLLAALLIMFNLL